VDKEGDDRDYVDSLTDDQCQEILTRFYDANARHEGYMAVSPFLEFCPRGDTWWTYRTTRDFGNVPSCRMMSILHKHILGEKAYITPFSGALLRVCEDVDGSAAASGFHPSATVSDPPSPISVDGGTVTGVDYTYDDGPNSEFLKALSRIAMQLNEPAIQNNPESIVQLLEKTEEALEDADRIGPRLESMRLKCMRLEHELAKASENYARILQELNCHRPTGAAIAEKSAVAKAKGVGISANSNTERVLPVDLDWD